MGRKKLRKIFAIKEYPNVFEEPGEQKGRWDEHYFQNGRPLVLELACGKGDYTLELAELYPQKNFIGVDLKGVRLYAGSKRALEADLDNVAFVRTRIETLDDYFAPGEVSEIWITFPDPYPKPSKAEKRLVSPRFLEVYRHVLKPNSILHLKTDDENLFNYGLECIEAQPNYHVLGYTYDLTNSQMLNRETAITTPFERKWRKEGRQIKYLRFQYLGLTGHQ